MIDSNGRKINYLRISVTDRCNLRCSYCMPECGVTLLKHSDILSFEEIVDFVKVAVERGIDKVRLTGGEPLVRKGIVNLVGMLAEIKGIKDFSMTTNGILLPMYALDLKNAGLHRLNISCDSVNAERYREITRMGNLEDFLKGINAAKKAGFKGLKINTVIENSVDEPDAKGVADWARKEGFEIRFIHKMDLKKGFFKPVEGGEGGICDRCNRLRLTADGYLKPCLFSDLQFSIRELGMDKALEMALKMKPLKGSNSDCSDFFRIGG